MTIAVDEETDTPIDIGISSHLQGLRRSWRDVQKLDGRPVIFVGHGSHALYFAYRPEGYDASTRLNVQSTVVRLDGQIAFGSARDHVRALPQPPDLEAQLRKYVLVALPDPDTVSDPSDEFDRWWWLRFNGVWGPVGSVAGPWMQGIKWEAPSLWVKSLRDDP